MKGKMERDWVNKEDEEEEGMADDVTPSLADGTREGIFEKMQHTVGMGHKWRKKGMVSWR